MKRKDAIALGLSVYTSDKSCRRGHSEFSVKSGCVTCNRARASAHYRKNPATHKARARGWAKDNPEKRRDIQKGWWRRNPEKSKTYSAARRAANPAKARQASGAWKKQNRGRATAIESKRRAAKIERTPPWADHEANARVYVNCPPGMTVDHIIPLQGRRGGKRIVSGLHVHTNLQYLTPGRNSSKGNHYTREDAEAAEAWQMNWLRERGLA